MISHSAPTITEADVKAVADTLRSGYIGRWEKTRRLERRMADMVDAKYAMALSSGSAALISALRMLGAPRVLVPTYCCEAVLKAVRYAGATPIPYDIGESRGDADAAIVVNGPFATYPRPWVRLIEDFAQVMPTGKLRGEYGVFSFGPLKPYTGGLGGVLVGNEPLDESDGELFPMADLNASLALSQLERPPANLHRSERMEGGVRRHAARFAERGVTVRREVGALLHRYLGFSDAKFPVAVDRWENFVSLPDYPALSEEQRARIEDARRLHTA